MPARKIILFFLMFCFAFSCVVVAQERLVIYRDETRDTIAGAIEIFQTEVNKSRSVNIETQPEDQFRNQGILISANVAKWPAYKKVLDKMGPEAVLVKSKGQSVAIIGNSQMAVQHGIFIYLEQLGYRYYFPHPDWYIVPARINFFKKINYAGQPSFDHRRIWYAYSNVGSKFSDDNYIFWFKANRLGGSMNAVVGHAYDDIVARNRDSFLVHPEWFYPVPAKGVLPGNPKFDLANPLLVQFVTRDVMNRLDKAKAAGKPIKMISLCPSDGLGTCNTPACQKLGTATDRVFSLINTVAKAISVKHPGTWMSGMSYVDYADPPTKKLEPNTFVSIATAFGASKYSNEDLIGKWSRKAGKVGIYDYLGLYAWDFDLPGKSAGGQDRAIAKIVKNYYKLGARGYDAETTPGSINKGLGHYIVARLLWNATLDTEAERNEFFTNCFGKVADRMKKLWDDWAAYPYDMVRETDLADWIDRVQAAMDAEPGADIKKRLAHIQVYLTYLCIYNKYRESGNAENELLTLLTFSYNTYDWAAFSGYPIIWELGNKSTYAGLKFNDPAARYKKKNNSLSNAATIVGMLADYRSTLKKKEVVNSVGLDKELRRVTANTIFTDKKYKAGLNKGATGFIGPHYFVFQVTRPGKTNYLDFAGDFLTGGGGPKPIVITIAAYNGVVNDDGKKLFSYDYIQTRDTQRLYLDKLPKGTYLLKVDDPKKYFSIKFGEANPYALIANAKNKYWGTSYFLCFFVPKGTQRFRVFKDNDQVQLFMPSGKSLTLPNRKIEEADVTVPPGEDGIWLIQFMKGKFHIEGVPPYFSMDPTQLLVPVK